MSFSKLNIISPILKSLERGGYKTPTLIQDKAIPIILSGKDIIGLSQTGTGKTAAFTLPILQLLTMENRETKFRPIRALILVPTRELALQIEKYIKTFTTDVNLRCACVVGGMPIFKQRKAIRRGADLLVATPGRLEDMIRQKDIEIDRVQTIVLDEADRMLDIGFLPAINRILSMVPKPRQTLFFSATMPADLKGLCSRNLVDPVEIVIGRQKVVADGIDEKVLFAEQKDKLLELTKLLKNFQNKKVIVFARTKASSDRLAKSLIKADFRVDAIHGNKSQNQRQRALENFKRGSNPILIATDIASRGIDVPDITAVVNFDVPEVPENYVHRVGRTARAGAKGNAITLCSPSEMKYLKAIDKLLNKTLSHGGPDLLPSKENKRSRAKKVKKKTGQPRRLSSKPIINKGPDEKKLFYKSKGPTNKKLGKSKPNKVTTN